MDGNGWTEHARLIRVDALMRKWRADLQLIRDMILDGDITPLTLIRKSGNVFLCSHDIDMDGFEPRPWKQFGAELDVYFDRDEIEHIEKQNPKLTAPPPKSSPPWLAPKTPPHSLPSPPGPMSSSSSAQAQAGIAELEQQLDQVTRERDALAAKLAEIEADKVPSEDDPGDVPRNAKANQGKEEKTAKNWAASLEAAVALAVECTKAGRPKSIKQHLVLWRKRWPESTATKPRKDAFDAFRRGLPAGLKGD